MVSTQPTLITKSDPARLEIEWDDGHRTTYSPAELRRLCPCAQCVDEVTGVRRLDPDSVADDLTQRDVQLVGNYALGVVFSDGHSTGIFTFPMLRENDPGRS